MKRYTFEINKPKNNTSTNANYSKIIDDIILNNIKKNNSYLFNKKENKNINIDTKITKKKPIEHKNIIIDDFFKFADNYINIFNKYKTKDDYDFLLSDGTPVKMFSNEIQIGYELLPINFITKSIYEYFLSESQKKHISEIIIKVA